MRKEDIERIAPDMRAFGKVENLLIPPFDQRKSKAEVGICKTLLGGKWLGKNTALQEEYLPRADGTRLRLLVIQPKDTTPDGPGLLWIHGGGYGTGVPEQDFFYIDRFCTAANCTVVTPDYRLSYEAPYPAGLQDCYAALKWMRGNASRFGIHTDQLFVGGDSAGGGMAAAVALYARDQKEVAVAFQMLFFPMLDDRMATPSSQNNRMPVWDSDSNEKAWKAYLGPLYGTEDVPCYAAPARVKDFTGLPPACAFVGTVDPFYDETAQYMRSLQEAGIPARFKAFEGCYHAFDVMAPRSEESKEAREFYMDCFNEAVARYFAKQP